MHVAESMTIVADVDQILAAISLIIILGYVGDAIFRATRIPEILILMSIGIAIGPLAHVLPDSYISTLRNLAPIFSSIALIMILFNSGTAMRIFDKESKGYVGVVLAFLDVALSCLAVGALMHYVFQWPLVYGALLGVIVGETSSVIVLPIAKKLKISKDLYNILIMETIFNSVFSILAFYLILVFITGSNFSPYSYVQYIVDYMSVPVLLGLLTGIIWIALRNTIKVASNYTASLAIAILLYSLVDFLGGSAAMSILVYAVIMGNDQTISKLMHMSSPVSNKKSKFVEREFEFIIRTFFFVFIGMIAILSVDYLIFAVAVTAALLLLRLIEVNPLILRVSKSYRNLTYSLMQKGLGVAVLSSIYYGLGLPYSTEIFSVSFTIIILSNIISAVLIRWSSKQIMLVASTSP